MELRARGLKERSKEDSSPRTLPRSDTLASGLAVAALALVAGFISLPILSLVVWTISEDSWRAMASPVARDALLLSMRTTAISMFIIVLVGTPAAYVLARADFRGKRLWTPWWTYRLYCLRARRHRAASHLRTVRASGRYFDAFGVTISFTTAGRDGRDLVAAHFYVRQASIGFARVRRDVEEAAMVDGAGGFLFSGSPCPWRSRPWSQGAHGVGSGAWRVRATVIFAGSFRGITQTIPLAIFADSRET